MHGGAPPGGMWAPPQAPWWDGPEHLLALVLLVVLIGVVVWAVLRTTIRRAQLAAAASPTEDAAGLELRLRYARGDISREDYLARGADLGLVARPMPEAPPSQE
jgi:putative membrane protein